MNNQKVETCICLHYIGDNGPCPRHGDLSADPQAETGRESQDEPKPTTPKSQAPA